MSLPRDVWISILEQLLIKDILSCRLVCRGFKDLLLDIKRLTSRECHLFRYPGFERHCIYLLKIMPKLRSMKIMLEMNLDRHFRNKGRRKDLDEPKARQTGITDRKLQNWKEWMTEFPVEILKKSSSLVVDKDAKMDISYVIQVIPHRDNYNSKTFVNYLLQEIDCKALKISEIRFRLVDGWPSLDAGHRLTSRTKTHISVYL